MNVFVQKMSEVGRIQNLNVSSGLNPGGSTFFDKFTFDSLVNSIKSDGSDQSLRPERVNYQDDYGRYERISRRSDRSEMQKEINNRQYNDKSEEIYGRRYENRDRNDEYDDTVNKKGDPDPLAFERGSGSPEDASAGEKSLKESSPTEGDSLMNVQPADTPVDESEAVLNGEGGGERDETELGTAMQTDALLSLLINSEVEGLTDTSQAGSGNVPKISGSGEGGGSEAKAGDALNGKPVIPADPINRPLNSSEIKESAGSESTMTENKPKTDILMRKTPDTFVNEDVNDAEETLIGVRAKSTHQDAQKDRAREIKSIDDVKAGPDFREGSNPAKPLTEKQLSEYVLNFNREAALKSNLNTDPRAVRVEPVNSNTGLPNNSVVAHQGGKISEVMNIGNATRPSSFAEAVDKIVYVVKGNNRLGVTIEHKDLGKLNINLSLERGLVNVHINTADKAVREFVENNIQQIIDSLSKNGVSIGGFSVGLRNHRESEGNGNGNGNRDKKVSVAGEEQGKGYLDVPKNAPLNNGLLSIFA